MRKFHREIFDPADGIAVFEKRFDEQHTGAMLSNKFVRLFKSMCGTANMIPGVAANNCNQALLTNDTVADRHDPAWFCFFHGSPSLINRLWPLQSFNCVRYRNTFTALPGRHKVCEVGTQNCSNEVTVRFGDPPF